MTEPHNKICPLLSIGAELPCRCQLTGCAWYVPPVRPADLVDAARGL